MEKKLTKSATNRKIFGVCGGVGEYFGIDPTILRILAVFSVCFLGCGLLAYLLAALVMPNE